MNTISVATLDALDPADCLAIRSRLTNPKSEFQVEVSRVLSGESSSITPIAMWHMDGALLAWACSHRWKDFAQTLEQYTDPHFRRRGIGMSLASALIAAGVLCRSEPVAVFSPATEAAASRLWMPGLVERFERLGNEWVPATPPH